MGKKYEHTNEYEVDVGDWGKIEVFAHSHSEARYLAYIEFINAYGSWHYDSNYKHEKSTLLWFAKISRVRMTLKSVLNQ